MRTTLFAALLLLASATVKAQNERFEKGMKANLVLLDSAKNAAQFNDVAASFERIAEAEKTQWLPYYYAAMANIWKAFSDAGANKDEVASKAEALLDKAEQLEPQNAEVNVGRYLSAILRMMVDPMNRYMQYGQMAAGFLQKAKQISPENPRITLMEAQSLMQTPAQFGGGKDKAKPVAEKAVAQFKAFTPATPLHPNWGAEMATQLVVQASK